MVVLGCNLLSLGRRRWSDHNAPACRNGTSIGIMQHHDDIKNNVPMSTADFVTLRERHAGLTRSTILTAARRLFAERGYAATPVRLIAEEAGVAVQTLYAAFGSKQGLLLPLVDTIREEVPARALWDQIEASDDPLEALRMAAHLRRLILERCGDIVTMFTAQASLDRDVATVFVEGQSRNRAGIARLCRRLEELGVLRSGLDQARAVDQAAALFASEIYGELVDRSGWSAEQYEVWLSDRLRDMLVSPVTDERGG